MLQPMMFIVLINAESNEVRTLCLICVFDDSISRICSDLICRICFWFDSQIVDFFPADCEKRTSIGTKVDECIMWLSIIFITILCTPQPTIVRWSSTPPVSDEMIVHWKGFCAIIANAYFVRGMAWLPVKTLQLEQMAVVGHAEEPSVVASRMRLVFTTLEVVSPQWPRG
ncbi:uncharacterized protein LOC107783754 isoform X1 [Nicotiana tabacum]|uniref:Uncharacterized protein LOC107783754 isoform X1 n=1 Tax=Nicotiana tabacum TaxID=4097 RepID=A0AC58UAE5_TOBAC